MASLWHKRVFSDDLLAATIAPLLTLADVVQLYSTCRRLRKRLYSGWAVVVLQLNQHWQQRFDPRHNLGLEIEHDLDWMRAHPNFCRGTCARMLNTANSRLTSVPRQYSRALKCEDCLLISSHYIRMSDLHGHVMEMVQQLAIYATKDWQTIICPSIRRLLQVPIVNNIVHSMQFDGVLYFTRPNLWERISTSFGFKKGILDMLRDEFDILLDPADWPDYKTLYS